MCRPARRSWFTAMPEPVILSGVSNRLRPDPSNDLDGCLSRRGKDAFGLEAQLRAPTLLHHGDDDLTFSHWIARTTWKYIDHNPSRVLKVDISGHAIIFEYPLRHDVITLTLSRNPSRSTKSSTPFGHLPVVAGEEPQIESREIECQRSEPLYKAGRTWQTTQESG
jgi:hypothetical protein